jgi:hypothetical protein
MTTQDDGNDIGKLAEEARRASADGVPPPVEDLEDDEVAVDGVETGVPSWATVPANFTFPPGWLVWFIRFPAKLTNRPGGPERQCILWNLNEADEKRAARLARGDGMRVIDEMAKQMIRSIDGKRVSFGPVSGAEQDQTVSLQTFWSEIGGKYRAQLKSLYLKTHAMDAAENADFFEHCVAPRMVG